MPMMPTMPRTLPVVQCQLPIMGTEAHVVVVGPPDESHGGQARLGQLANLAADRLRQLEARWSRFRLDSEISRLNRAEGQPVAVSADTLELVRRGLQAWRVTAGRYDPTVLPSMVEQGYDASFEVVRTRADSPPDVNRAHTLIGPRVGGGAEQVEIDAKRSTVRLGIGVGFDAGGIGKGLAGDLVVGELLAAGGIGALVNIGGDTVLAGTAPAPSGWQVGIADVHSPEPGALQAVVGLSAGAVATSSRLLRRWHNGDGAHHHLLDPGSGQPLDNGLDAVTVLASTGWWAEALAKAAFVAGAHHAAAVIAAGGGTGLLVTSDGIAHPLEGLNAHLS